MVEANRGGWVTQVWFWTQRSAAMVRGHGISTFRCCGGVRFKVIKVIDRGIPDVAVSADPSELIRRGLEPDTRL